VCAPSAGESEGPGRTPRPTARVLKRYNEFIQRVIDPENVLDLVIGRPRLLILKEPPTRVQIAEPLRQAVPGARAAAEPTLLPSRVATFTLVTERELSVVGEQVGTTVLNIWFGDPKEPAKQTILSYLVRVFPDPSARDRRDEEREETRERYRLERQRHYKRLEAEINHAFPDSSVCLEVVGDNVVLCGEAKDIAEATHIIRIVQSNPYRAAGPVTTTREVSGTGTADVSGTVDEVPVSGGLTRNTTAVVGLAGTTSTTTETQRPPTTPQTRGNLINMLRIPSEQQVVLRVVVAEVNRAAARSIGINFSVANRAGMTVFENSTGGIINGTSTPTSNGVGSTAANLMALMDNGQVFFAINALRTLDYSRSLAEPDLVTMNGQTATFQAGGAFPVPIVSGFTAAGLQGVQFIPFGIQLAFTPYITDRDRIRLNVQANVSTRDLTTVNVSGSQVPSNLNTRNVSTVVEMREGQTLAVAGLIQNNLAVQSDRVPWLGDLPYIGRFAAFDRIQHADQELIMLVTPELVHPLNHNQLKPLPGSDIYEPSDLEFYLFGRLESRRSYDFRSPYRTDINKMVRYRRCEDLFIYGAHGSSEPPAK
jgi:pilus assembly protein CpaC